MLTAVFRSCSNLFGSSCSPAKTGVQVSHSRFQACFYFIAKQSVRLISTVSPPPPPLPWGGQNDLPLSPFAVPSNMDRRVDYALAGRPCYGADDAFSYRYDPQRADPLVRHPASYIRIHPNLL